MTRSPDKPLLIQGSDRLLLEITAEKKIIDFLQTEISKIAVLISAPEYVQTYKLSKVAVWNALDLDINISGTLAELSKYTSGNIPPAFQDKINTWVRRYAGILIKQDAAGQQLSLLPDTSQSDIKILRRVLENELKLSRQGNSYILPLSRLYKVKEKLFNHDFNIKEQFCLKQGSKSDKLAAGEKPAFSYRNYQLEAAAAVTRSHKSGIIVMPCGAGKTVAGIKILTTLQVWTLIITPHKIANQQWQRELIQKPGLKKEIIADYNQTGQTAPVTIVTYSQLNSRNCKLLQDTCRGLIIFDECQFINDFLINNLPLYYNTLKVGLTATPGKDEKTAAKIYNLIGPCLYKQDWKKMAGRGWIARAVCREIRVPLARETRFKYYRSAASLKQKLASLNLNKLTVCEKILNRHS
ncbi:MAG TPA: DEAD/DEAH box helicase family protein, partial [Spirochaetota bacterium]|nr:DEAD/DEAH box helicase family protein [Spirochaetota bacterium]